MAPSEPCVVRSGAPRIEGVTSTPAKMSYADAAAVPSAGNLDEAALAALMGGNAARLFGF